MMQKRKIKNIFTVSLFVVLFFLASFIFLFFPSAVAAEKSSMTLKGALDIFGEKTGLGDTEVSDESLVEMIAGIVAFALGFLAVLFLILIIYAGFLWMTAAGSEERVTKAKKIIIRALIGVIIVILAYFVTWVLLKLFEQITTDYGDSGDPLP